MEERNLPRGTVLHERYEVLEKIGSGGFSIIYKGMDRLINSYVTIKELFPEKWMTRDSKDSHWVQVTEQEGFLRCRKSFQREAQILKELRNVPHIARFRDTFSENGTEYIVMNFVSGKPLLEYARERGGKIPAAELVSYFEYVFEALGEIHALGFLHRDISPNNLILTETKGVVLIDFGAATAMDQRSSLWNDEVFDHPGFEAPEHSMPLLQGSWTDIYSVCATFVYLLTAIPVPTPQEREKYDEVLQNIAGHSLSARQQNILLRGLVVDRNRRCAGVKELRLELCGEIQQQSCDWKVEYLARTDIGSKNCNQDNLIVDEQFYFEGEDFTRSGMLFCHAGDLHLVAVCDGVGGANHGELASRAAVQALWHFLEYYRKSDKLPERLIEELLDQMNEKIVSLGRKIGRTATTVSLLLWKDNRFYAVNIGDSPIYLLRRRRLFCISTPHTRAQVYLMSGRSAALSDRHTLMNYLGRENVAGSQIASYYQGYLKPGDVFLLCTDGVSNQVDDDLLRRYLGKKKDKPVEAIWRKLNRESINDNCSAIVLRFMEAHPVPGNRK